LKVFLVQVLKKLLKSRKKVVEAKTQKHLKGDEFKNIEGVGPKAAEALVAAGIDTFKIS
jgi:large subunit ribosomal protein L21